MRAGQDFKPFWSPRIPLGRGTRYTHFLSLPLAVGEVSEATKAFQAEARQLVDPSLFMPVARLHFTICMLKLHSDELVDTCKRVLKELDMSKALPEPLVTESATPKRSSISLHFHCSEFAVGSTKQIIQLRLVSICQQIRSHVGTIARHVDTFKDV